MKAKRKAKIGENVMVTIGRCWGSDTYRAKVVYVYKNGNVDAVYLYEGERRYATNLPFDDGEESDTFRFPKQ